jgi:hypothetical protein
MSNLTGYKNLKVKKYIYIVLTVENIKYNHKTDLNKSIILTLVYKDDDCIKLDELYLHSK